MALPTLPIGALPTERACAEWIDMLAPTASRALHAIRPATLYKEVTAGSFGRKAGHELLERHHGQQYSV